MTAQRFSCHTCYVHFESEEENPICPECGEKQVAKRCSADPYGGCKCLPEDTSSIAYCKVCGKPVCPTCGDHNVVQISRVTGYLADVAGWNAGKAQELKDRTRTPVSGEGRVLV